MTSNHMVTGAAGSIGSELVRQLLNRGISEKITCVDHNENGLFTLQQSLGACKEQLEYVTADVSNSYWLDDPRIETVETVFHAAAYKHVPLSQSNSLYYFMNNIRGMLRVLDFVEEKNAELVLVSTDKAVYPNNVMGYTKRLCELLLLHRRRQTEMIVRFGNVLNSNGSVIPIFRKQIASGGPVTVTTAETSRFFMSINQAVELIINAYEAPRREKISILDMGPEVKIDTLARNMIEESGHRVVSKGKKQSDQEIEIEYIGLRPGEKERELLTYGVLTENDLVTAVHEDISPSDDLIEYIVECERNSVLPEFSSIDWVNGCRR